jgi:integrase
MGTKDRDVMLSPKLLVALRTHWRGLAGVHIHAHRWRHTFTTELLSKGVPVSEVAAIWETLRGSSRSITRNGFRRGKNRGTQRLRQPGNSQFTVD